MRILALLTSYGIGFGLLATGCSDDQGGSDNTAVTGGASGSTGGGTGFTSGSGGTSGSTGGATVATGGTTIATGGTTIATGGTTIATGGTTVATGGTTVATGGTTVATGGTATGGTSTGGTGTGGDATGGTGTGGDATGGTGTGGDATGGTDSGGSDGTGGDPGTGGDATGGVEDTSECSDTSMEAGTLTGDEGSTSGSIQVDGKDKTYIMHTNWWWMFNGQAVDYDGLSFTIRDPNNTAVSSTEGNPTGFPTMYIGTYAGHSTIGSNLPIAVPEITTVATVLRTNSLSKDTSNFNATYDVWFTANSNTIPNGQWDPGLGGAYLMVWLFDPSDRQPRGGNWSVAGSSPTYTGTTVEDVENNWDVWVDNTDPLCISYVATSPMDSLEFDLNYFIRDSVEKGYGITESMYLSIVFGGFEIWGGGDGLQLEQYCVDVQ